MEEIMFLNRLCRVYHFPVEPEIKERLFAFTGNGADQGFLYENGTIEIRKESQVALDKLLNGEGILYNEGIYFEATAIKGKQENWVDASFRIFLFNLNSFERKLYYSLKEKSSYPMVRQMFTLLEKGIFSETMLVKKITSYLLHDTSDDLLIQYFSKAG